MGRFYATDELSGVKARYAAALRHRETDFIICELNLKGNEELKESEK